MILNFKILQSSGTKCEILPHPLTQSWLSDDPSLFNGHECSTKLFFRNGDVSIWGRQKQQSINNFLECRQNIVKFKLISIIHPDWLFTKKIKNLTLKRGLSKFWLDDCLYLWQSRKCVNVFIFVINHIFII